MSEKLDFWLSNYEEAKRDLEHQSQELYVSNTERVKQLVSEYEELEKQIKT